MRWAYCVTTVPERRRDLLPRTLASLAQAGFGQPRLYVDGWDGRGGLYDGLGLEVTARQTRVRTHGNWVLSLYETYIRHPDAERYAIFQDDLATVRNLHAYLDRCAYQPRTYWNLYTFPSNQGLCPRDEHNRPVNGWYRSNQFGRGAVGLVLDRETVLTLLSSRYMVERPLDCHRGHRSVDGGIVTALAREGWSEMVHHPSLVQHTGDVSAMGNRPHQKASSFPGEEYDALTLLEASHAAG
jgi:hypothetical protein